MTPKLRHAKTQIIPPNKPPSERPHSPIYESIDQPHYVKLMPLAALIVIVLGIFAISYVGIQASIKGYEATVAQAQAIEKQAEAIERQTAVIEGMAERRVARAPNSQEVKDLMIFIAIVLGVVAAIKCASD